MVTQFTKDEEGNEEFAITPEGIRAAQEEERVEVVEVEEVEDKPKDELSDLFTVPQLEDNDMAVADLFQKPGPTDLSDLTRVNNEDIIEGISLQPSQPRTRRVVRRISRVNRREPPPPSISGVRF